MTFFNKKEEVIEIELTQYGKYLLSKGIFKPVYYTFSDDDILYDYSYAAPDDALASRPHERIQNTTPRTRIIYEHDGAESRVLALNGHKTIARRGDFKGTRMPLENETPVEYLYSRDPVDSVRMGADDRNLVRNRIGTSELGNQYAPAWSVMSLNEEEFANPVQMSSSTPNIGFRAPILEMEVDYELLSVPFPEEITNSEYNLQNGDEKDLFFVDNMRIFIDERTILLDIEEENVDDKKANFDVEFFCVESTKELVRASGTIVEEILSNLYIRDGSMDQPDKADVLETYFEVLIDEEIPSTATSVPEPDSIYNFNSDDEGLCD